MMPRTSPPGSVRARARTAGAVALLAATGLVASCAPSSPDATASPSQPPPGLEKYYAQDLAWSTCSEPDLDGLQCARLTVPLDYADPGGATIETAVARSVAEHHQGSVVINPGGPGGSGIDAVSGLVQMAGSVADRLDVVGFDPRGVGRSTPVDCGDAPRPGQSDVDPSTPEGQAQVAALWATFGQACAEHTGALLGHVDTVSAARDMDVLRAALGEQTLTYWAVSYGTRLGQTYAALFPQHVGRMVLDGALPATLTGAQEAVGSAQGHEQALRAYVADCLTSADCPLHGSVDEAVAQVGALVDDARAHPLDTGTSQLLTGYLATLAVMAAGDSRAWGDLTAALRDAIVNHDGAALLELAGGATATTDAGGADIAIMCADTRSDPDPAATATEVEQIRAAAPTFRPMLQCPVWPTPVTAPLPSYAATGAPTVGVVGTTGDPATPYAWAQQMAQTFDSAVLVTYDGIGHTALLSGSTCVLDLSQAYLVDGTVPADGTVCRT